MKIEKLQRHTLKVLSALLAVSLWFYVLNSEPIEVEKKLAIKYIMPKGMVMTSFSEKEVTLKIKGSKAFVENIFANKERFTVDLNPYFQSTGKNFRVKFYSTSVDVPFGVEILDISPKETLVELDQKGMMELPVKVQMIGELPHERRLKEFKINPDTVMVSGPIEILRTLRKIETAPLNLSMVNKDEGSIVLQVIPLDPRVEFAENFKLKFTYKTKKL